MPSEEQQNEQFIEKLGEIPVVNDGWTLARGYYTRVKDYNSLTKFSFGVAENSVLKAAEMSKPVLNRYQPQIDTVNNFACNKLDDLENKYTIIKQPSAEVRDACLEYVQPYVDQVKPVVSYVNGVVDTTQKSVNCIKTCSTNIVVGAKDLGVNSVNKAVTMTLESPPGRLVTNTVDWSLTQADGLIDKFIPPQPLEENDGDDDNDTDESSEDNGAIDTNGSTETIEEMELEPPSAERVVIHFKKVSNKLRRRLYQRAMRDFNDAKVRTVEALKNLNYTVDLVDYAKKNIEGARSKAQEIWGQIIVDTDKDQSSENAVSASVLTGTLEERIVALGRILTRQVKYGVSALEQATHEAGLFVKDPITKSKEYRDLVYQFGTTHIPTVESARAAIKSFQQRLQSMIDSIESPAWLSVDIDMDGISLEEESVHDYVDPTPRNENHI